MSNIPRTKGRPSNESKALRALPGPRPFMRPDERGDVRHLRDDDDPADYRHWYTRRALYEALTLHAPREFSQLADAATREWASGVYGFTREVLAWINRYQFGPAPCPEESWLEWFYDDAMDSYMHWAPNRGTYRIIPTCRSDERLDSVEAEAVVRTQLVEMDRDALGERQPRILSRAELMEAFVDRFKSVIAPKVDEMIERAETLGVVGALPSTLDDDVRRYVLKHFRRLTVKEIAAAERRGDSSVTDEHFRPEELRDVVESDADVRDIYRSIQDVANLLGAPAYTHPSGPKPVHST
jgi:hypothetical protein